MAFEDPWLCSGGDTADDHRPHFVYREECGLWVIKGFCFGANPVRPCLDCGVSLHRSDWAAHDTLYHGR